VYFEKYAKINISATVIDASNISDDNITYLIKVNNPGEFELKDVMVVDSLPVGMKYQDSHYMDSKEAFLLRCLGIDGNGTINNITWSLGNLQTNEEKVIELRVSKKEQESNEWDYKMYVQGRAIGMYVNDTEIGNESSVRNGLMIAGPALSLKKSLKEVYGAEKRNIEKPLQIGSVGNGNRTVYHIEAENIGDTVLRNVTIIDIMPNNMQFLGQSFSKTTDDTTSTGNFSCDFSLKDGIGGAKEIEWKVGDLEKGAVVKINLIVGIESNLNPLNNSVLAMGEFLDRKISKTANAVDSRA
jgi:uncharacterized repeat protein (TIGR01451 family)